MTSFIEKEKSIRELFPSEMTSEERYKKIITLGRGLPPLNKEALTQENLVSGCQSLLYLSHSLTDGKMYFSAHSDALISKGLAALLIHLYSGETPETIVKKKPTVFQEIGIATSISPARIVGLQSLYKKMQLCALQKLSL